MGSEALAMRSLSSNGYSRISDASESVAFIGSISSVSSVVVVLVSHNTPPGVSFAYENGLAEAMIILIANTNDKHRCFMWSLSFILFAN